MVVSGLKYAVNGKNNPLCNLAAPLLASLNPKLYKEAISCLFITHGIFRCSIPRFFEVKTEFVSVDRCVEHMIPQNGSDNSAIIDGDDDIIMVSNEQVMIRTNTCTTEWVAKIKVTELRFNPYYVSVSIANSSCCFFSFSCQEDKIATGEIASLLLQIYALYLNMIVNICLPLALLVAMNICIYRTMRNQWYRPPSASSGASIQHHLVGGGHAPHQQQNNAQPSSFVTHLFCRRRSSAASEHQVTTPAAIAASVSGIRRVGGLTEAEFKKRDAKYTRASVVMVVAFVVCNTPRFVPNIMEIFIGQEHFPQVRRISKR